MAVLNKIAKRKKKKTQKKNETIKWRTKYPSCYEILSYDCVVCIWNFIKKQQAQTWRGWEGGQGENIYKL